MYRSWIVSHKTGCGGFWNSVNIKLVNDDFAVKFTKLEKNTILDRFGNKITKRRFWGKSITK